MAAHDCIEDIVKATNGFVDEETAKNIAEDLYTQKQRLLEQGEAVNVGLRLQELGQTRAGAVLDDAKAAQVRTQQSILSQRRTLSRIEAQIAEGVEPHTAILNAIEGTVSNVSDGRVSIGALRQGYINTYNARWLARMMEERPELLTRFRKDKDFQEEVTIEVLSNLNGGMSDDARYVAELVSEVFEEIRQTLNARGANIARLEGYLPQRHNVRRLLREGFDEWAAFIRPRLINTMDEEALRRTYEKIIFGDNTAEDVLTDNIAPAGAENKFKAMSHARELHFKDAGSWLEYNKLFGDGGIISALTGYIEQVGNVLSVQDVLGHRPKDGLEKIKAAVAQTIQNSALDDVSKNNKKNALYSGFTASSIDAALRVATRQHLGLPSEEWGQRMGLASQGLRTVHSLSKLGAATLSAFPGDLATTLVNARYHGMPLFDYATRNMRDTLGRMPKKLRQEVAAYLGAGYDGLIGHIASRYDANEGMRGALAKVNEAFFKATFLTQVTDWQRAGAARMHARWLGSHSHADHHALPNKLMRSLKQHGIGKQEWQVIRQAIERYSEENYVMPHKIQTLSDEVIDTLIDAKAKQRAVKLAQEKGVSYDVWYRAALDAKRNALETKLAAMMADETTFAVLVGDDFGAKYTTGGLQDGTPKGIAWRLIMQFKTFPIAFTQRVLGRAIKGTDDASEMASQISTIFAAATLAGVAVYTLKEIAKGNTPPDFSKEQNVMTAIATGGGLGIYGDFLFATESRYGQSFFDTMAGPTMGTLNQFARTTGDAVLKRDLNKAGKGLARMGLDNLPGKNIWWSRTVVDGLILDDLHTMISPRYQQNKARWRRRRGQKKLWE